MERRETVGYVSYGPVGSAIHFPNILTILPFCDFPDLAALGWGISIPRLCLKLVDRSACEARLIRFAGVSLRLCKALMSEDAHDLMGSAAGHAT